MRRFRTEEKSVLIGRSLSFVEVMATLHEQGRFEARRRSKPTRARTVSGASVAAHLSLVRFVEHIVPDTARLIVV